VNEECVPDCGENAICKGIVRGQPDCECKEGCKGDPFKKCDCDLPNPANETQADPGTSCNESTKCYYKDLKVKRYDGCISTTASGKSCQAWASTVPHNHTYLSLEGNYCRTDNHTGPWCFTTDPDERWEECLVPICNEETDSTPPPPLPPVGVNEECVPDCGENAICKGIVRGQPDCECKEGCKGDPFKKCDCDLPNPANETQADPGTSCNESTKCYYKDLKVKRYDGCISTTASGKSCQAWASTVPHNHTYTHLSLEGNYCRTDDHTGPWCYTTDPNKKWEDCLVPICNEGTSCNKSTECYYKDLKVKRYDGCVSTTASGKSCQAWASTVPHNHKYTYLSLEGNYCRTDDHTKPWCFTTDPNKQWEDCLVPICNEGEQSTSAATTTTTTHDPNVYNNGESSKAPSTHVPNNNTTKDTGDNGDTAGDTGAKLEMGFIVLAATFLRLLF